MGGLRKQEQNDLQLAREFTQIILSGRRDGSNQSHNDKLQKCVLSLKLQL